MSVARRSFKDSLTSLFLRNSKSILTSRLSLFFFLITLNIFSNLPFFASPALYYFFTLSLSAVVWGPAIFAFVSTRPELFFRHIIPYGAPIFLSFLLPLIELFRQVIRPFTLIIRLSTNLSAGHIMLYMFSLFSMSSVILSSMLFVLILSLILLEISISLLQAYIFTSLALMYVSETL